MTAFDLKDYLCPANGKAYTLTSNEACQSVQAADGWIEFRKNRHMEEFYVTDDVIGRGADTSLISNDGVHPIGTIYGCAWVARYMEKGQVYHRKCRVIVYDFTGRVLDDGIAESDIVLKDHHDTLLFPSGIAVNDVLEFQWGGEELYFYARDYGLVGWRNLRDGSFGNYIQRLGGNIQEPFAHAVPRPPVIRLMPAPVALPVYPKADDLGPVIRGKMASSAKVNLRDLPSTANGKVIGGLIKGDLVDYHASRTALFDGYTWYAVEAINGLPVLGWIASSVITFTSVAVSEKTLVDLGFVYVSQVDLRSNLKDNDCSLAVGIAAALTRMKQTGYGAMPLLTINNLIPFSKLKGAYDGLVSMADLEVFMTLLGVQYTYSDQLTPAAIKAHIQNGSGVLALLNYACLNPAYRFGHYALVAGLAEHDTFILNDSYLMGEGYQLSATRLQSGLTDLKDSKGVAFSYKPYQGYLLALR